MQSRFFYPTFFGFLLSASALVAQTGPDPQSPTPGTACVFGDNAFQLGMTVSVSGLNYTCRTSGNTAVWEQTDLSGVPLCLANGDLYSLRAMVSIGDGNDDVFSFCNSTGAWQRFE